MSTSTLTRTRFPSALLVAVGLAAGFGIAQGTGVRALGGAVFAAAGVAAGVLWLRRRGAATALPLPALYIGAFVLAPVLAIGVGVPASLGGGLGTLPPPGGAVAGAEPPRSGGAPPWTAN